MQLSARHSEIAVILALAGGGLSAGRLAVDLSLDAMSNVTVRADMCRLRTVLRESLVGSQPYQLEQAHDEAHHAATHDALTGLANRVLLQDALTAAMRSSDEQERVGLVYVDLDRFKDVNDTWGHSVGDALLQAVAGRLTQVVRGGDIAARLGGDEFVLLLRRLPPDWGASGFLARCRSVVEQPVMLPSDVINPQASFGLVTSSPATRDPDALLQLADGQMYLNKQARRDQVH